MAGKERLNPSSSFQKDLAVAVSAWAESLPNPDKVSMFFVGLNKEQLAYSPREYAEAIKQQDDFGKSRVKFYLEMIENAKKLDPTGGISEKTIIEGYQNLTRMNSAEKANPSKPVVVE